MEQSAFQALLTCTSHPQAGLIPSFLMALVTAALAAGLTGGQAKVLQEELEPSDPTPVTEQGATAEDGFLARIKALLPRRSVPETHRTVGFMAWGAGVLRLVKGLKLHHFPVNLIHLWGAPETTHRHNGKRSGGVVWREPDGEESWPEVDGKVCKTGRDWGAAIRILGMQVGVYVRERIVEVMGQQNGNSNQPTITATCQTSPNLYMLCFSPACLCSWSTRPTRSPSWLGPARVASMPRTPSTSRSSASASSAHCGRARECSP